MSGRLILLLAVLATLASASQMTSNFNDGTTQGWTILNWDPGVIGLVHPGGTLTVVASGGIGNSPYLQEEDMSNGFLYFAAPSSWAGNFLGGQLSFTLSNPNPNSYAVAGFPSPEVMIQGSGGPTLYYFGDGAGLDWTFNQIALAPGSHWSLSPSNSTLSPTDAQVTGTLSSITGVYILGDWVSGYFGKPGVNLGHDINGLDDVTLASPEPGTIMLTGIGLALALLGFRKRSCAS